MSAIAELRIQLEGAYERVERAAERFEAAATTLRRSNWHRATGWVALADLDDADVEALAALMRRASVEECAKLIQRLERAEHGARDALEQRLRLLGEPVEPTVTEQVERLGSHLPIGLAGDDWSLAVWVPVLGALAVALGVFVNVAVAICVLWSAVYVLFVRHVLASGMVTDRAFLAEGLAIPFAKIASVCVQYSGRSGTTLDVTSTDGPHRQLLLSAMRAKRVVDALRAKGVSVLEIGRADE